MKQSAWRYYTGQLKDETAGLPDKLREIAVSTIVDIKGNPAIYIPIFLVCMCITSYIFKVLYE